MFSTIFKDIWLFLIDIWLFKVKNGKWYHWYKLENKHKGKVAHKAFEGSEATFIGSDTIHFYGDDEK